MEAQPAWDEEAPSEPSEPTEAKGQRVRVRRNRRGKDAEEVCAHHQFERNISLFHDNERTPISFMFAPLSIFCSPTSQTPADPTGDKEVNKLELLLIGNRCYRRALKLQSSEVDHALLHDLAFNYFAQVDAIDEEDKDSRQELAANALECLKEAVSLDPFNHQYWLALG